MRSLLLTICSAACLLAGRPSYAEEKSYPLGAQIWDSMDVLDSNANDIATQRYFVIHTDVKVKDGAALAALCADPMKFKEALGQLTNANMDGTPTIGLDILAKAIVDAMNAGKNPLSQDLFCSIGVKTLNYKSGVETYADFRLYIAIHRRAYDNTDKPVVEDDGKEQGYTFDAAHLRLDHNTNNFKSAIDRLRRFVAVKVEYQAAKKAIDDVLLKYKK